MFRKVYAQIGFADTQGDLSDEEESDKLTKEKTPPATPVAENATPKLSLTQFISINLNKLQIQSKNQPAPAIPPPKSQALNQRNQPSPPTQSPTFPSQNSSTPPTGSPNPPHSSTPPLQTSQTIPSTFSVPLTRAPSLNSSSPLQPNPVLAGSSPVNYSPPFPPPPTSSSGGMPRNHSNAQLSQMKPSGSSGNLQDVARQSPIPLIPTPPLSSSPVVPVRTDSPQDRPIPPTAAPTTYRQSPDSGSFFISPPPSIPLNSSLSSVKRVSSVPQMAPAPVPLPPNATRRNSNTPSPLAQPWPSPEKSNLPPSLPISPNQLLVDIDDEEESLINRSTNVQAPSSLARPMSQPPPSSAPQPSRSSPQLPPQTSLPARPPSQPPPASQTLSLHSTQENPISSSPQSSPNPDLHTKPIQDITSPDLGLPNNRPSLRDSFQSDKGCSSSATAEPSEDIIKSGWLTKQDKAKENWARHFFSLTATSIYYYEGENENMRGKISLEGYEIIIVDPEEVDKQFCFMLTHTNKRVYYMHCETRDDMLSWIIAVQEILDNLKPSGSAPVKETLVPIAETDPKYELVYAMLHAIRFSVSKMAALPYLDIGLEELNANTSFSTDKQGSAAVPSSNYPYSFVDHAPKVFRKIREIYGFNCADYLLSLTSQYTLSELPTPGKSGSLFYYSNDRKFMLKTISATEFDNLRQMLPNYFLHLLQNPNTLLTRLFGLHKISTDNSRSIVFVVMENIFLDYEMEETYDLKGSTIGRKSDGTSSILKDLDWKRRILLDSDRRNSLLFQIELDCKFLEKNNIMDYSFLLGLRFINHSDEERNKRPFSSIFQREKGGYQATTEEGGLYDIVYYFGIIDIFTTYNIKKQLEHTYKSTIYETKDAISVVDAVKYAHRFRKFIASVCGWQPQKPHN